MKEIKISRMHLENFKCHRDLLLDFGGRSASIYGDNATGKTSIYDALTWLLFGKDSGGNGEKNFEVKPLDSSGQVADHNAITSVEVCFTVDGEELVLKRSYRELWSAKRGSDTQTYDGNTSEYFLDGVPCKQASFREKVGELVPEDTFRLLTSVSYFASAMEWKERRRVVMDMAGTCTDGALMAMDARFAPLMDAMGKRSLSDFRKMLLAQKKERSGVKDQIPARLDECQKTLTDLEGLDFVGARSALAELETKASDISAQMVEAGSSTAANGKKMEIQAVRLEMQKLDMENQQFRAAQTAGAPDAAKLQVQLGQMKAQTARNEDVISQISQELFGESGLHAQLNGLRERWQKVQAQVFTGGTCPTCGQTLLPEALKKAMDNFQVEKQKKLDRIAGEANRLKGIISAEEERMNALTAEVALADREQEPMEKQLRQALSAYDSVRDMDGYGEKAAEIFRRHTALMDELRQIESGASGLLDALYVQKQETDGEIRRLREILAKESVIAYTRERMDRLRKDARKAAEELERLDMLLYLSDEFIRYKVRFVEDRVNNLFRLARFRLFREQANGGLEERCDVVFDGVPYMGLNSGMKVNVGMDIIETLSHHYGVRVPLFVDNAESVTSLEPVGSQVIRLVVSERDKKLRCEYEN